MGVVMKWKEINLVGCDSSGGNSFRSSIWSLSLILFSAWCNSRGNSQIQFSEGGSQLEISQGTHPCKFALSLAGSCYRRKIRRDYVFLESLRASIHATSSKRSWGKAPMELCILPWIRRREKSGPFLSCWCWRVALKRINNVFRTKTDAKRALREITILRQCHHPNIAELK